jgi:acyl dehydratase
MLYAIGVGAANGDQTSDTVLRWTYENHPKFAALPTYGVIAPFDCICQLMDVPGLNFNPMMLLHGETALAIHAPIPTGATLTNRGHIVDVYDKRTAAVVVVEVDSFTSEGVKVFTNTYTLFIRGIGGFGGPSGPKVKPPSSAPPSRAPDFVLTESTLPSQALLYRLSGDVNPLHADPDMAAAAGFKTPILHGLCSFGHAGRAVLAACGGDADTLRTISVRMSKSVLPGDSLTTNVWREGADVFFQTINGRNGDVVLSNGRATVKPQGKL